MRLIHTRTLAILLLALSLPSLASAQRTATYQALTVDDTARSIADATLSGMSSCTAVLETAEIRWRNDGTAPTSTVGTPVAVGTAINFSNITDARLAQFIRTGGSSGVLHVNCFPSAGAVDVTGSGSGGGGVASEVAISDGADTALVSAGGELLVSCADCSGSGVSHVDDAAFTAATDDVVPIAGLYDDTSTDSVNEDDIGALRMTATRILMANLRNASGTDAFGTAGTAATPVLTIQGIASMTPLQVADNGGTLSVDDGDGALTVDGSVTVSATNLDVQIGGSDTLTVGTIATSIVPGTGATHLGKAEDAAHTTGDTGVMLFAVRNDAGTALAGTTGDYIPLSTDSSGALRVVGSSGTTQYAEDVAHNSGDSMVFMGAIRRDTTPSSSAGTAGDYSAINVDANGRLYVNATLYNSSGTELTAASDWTVGSAAGTTGPGQNAIYKDFDGSALPTTTNVDTEGEAVPVAASIVGVQYTMLTNEDGSLSPLAVHDASDATISLGIGARATNSTSGLTLVANADRTAVMAGLDGVLITRPYANTEDVVQDRATNTDGASTAFAGGLAAAGAGIAHRLTWCTVANTSASAITLDLRDGAAGSVIWSGPVPANTNGAHILFPTPLKFSANTAVAYDGSAAATTITITCGGFKSKI